LLTNRINNLAGYCLDPKNLLIHRYYGSHIECEKLLSNWQENISNPDLRSRLARKAAEGLYSWASENYYLDTLTELNSEYENLNRLPEIIERLKKNVRKNDDTIRQLFKSPSNTEILDDLNSICGLTDSICDRFFYNSDRYKRDEIINLLDYFVETLLEFKKLLPAKNKNETQLEKLGLPTTTKELISLVKKAFEEESQGELFSWWLTEQGFHSWCDVWLGSNYDEALIKYLHRLDPDFNLEPIKPTAKDNYVEAGIDKPDPIELKQILYGQLLV